MKFNSQFSIHEDLYRCENFFRVKLKQIYFVLPGGWGTITNEIEEIVYD